MASRVVRLLGAAERRRNRQPHTASLGFMKRNHILSAAMLTLGLASASPVQAADCYALGLQLAAEYGGQLARATPVVQDGQQVCRIVILVPGQEGARPRRAEYVVPAE
jgi:hypothetical protein